MISCHLWAITEDQPIDNTVYCVWQPVWLDWHYTLYVHTYVQRQHWYLEYIQCNKENIVNCQSSSAMLCWRKMWLLCILRPRNDLYCVGRDVKPYSLTVMHTDCCGLRSRFEHHVMGYKGPTLLFISFQNFLFVLAVDCPWK